MRCINHPDRKAIYLKDSYFKNKSPHPICKECKEKLEKYYYQLYNSLNIRKIED